MGESKSVYPTTTKRLMSASRLMTPMPLRRPSLQFRSRWELLTNVARKSWLRLKRRSSSEPGEQVQPTEDKLYVKLAHIGEGSYADVYLATPREPQLFGQQQFVIKELDVMSMEEKDQKKAVLEVNILSTLTHPNIIGYKESYIHDGFLCIVMEHADGGDLFHQISHARETGYFIEEKVILSWLAQILLALQYVHSNQLLHRDIKPQNIFLLGNGMVKL